MRFTRTAALVLVSCALGLTACGSDDDEPTAITTLPTVPTATDAAPSATTTTDGAATTTTETPAGDAATTTDGRPDAGSAVADDEVPSGGVSPSDGRSGSDRDTGGARPTITPGTAEEPASAIADDPAMIDLWCEQARQGAYDDQIGDATRLAITVRGSDDTRFCELPR